MGNHLLKQQKDGDQKSHQADLNDRLVPSALMRGLVSGKSENARSQAWFPPELPCLWILVTMGMLAKLKTPCVSCVIVHYRHVAYLLIRARRDNNLWLDRSDAGAAARYNCNGPGWVPE
jgi:hypothetical protein